MTSPDPDSNPSQTTEESSSSSRAADRFGIFEKVALERLRAGADATKPASFLPLPVRLTAIAAASIAGLGVVWAVFARVPVQVNGIGVFVCMCTTPRSQIRSLEAPTSGILHYQVSGFGPNTLPEEQRERNDVLRQLGLIQSGSLYTEVYDASRLKSLVELALAPSQGLVLDLSSPVQSLPMQTGKTELDKAPPVVSYPGGTVLARIEDQSAKEQLTSALVSTLPAESMLRQQQTGRIERAGRLGGLNALQANQRSSIERELNQRRELYQRYLKLWKQGYLPGTAVLEEQSRINSLESQLLNAESTQLNTKISRDDQIEQSKQASVSNLDSRNKLQGQLATYLSRTTVFAPVKGIYLLSRNFFNGSFVKQGQELFIYTTTPPYLPGTIPVFLDPATAQQVVEGMSVLVTPKGISRAQYGGIPGKVIEVSKQPLDSDGLLGALQSRALVPPIQQSVPSPYLVRVQLEKSTPSECNQARSYGCYRWSSGRRPPQPVRITSLADVQITTVHLRPIEFVMPALKRAFGLVVDNT
ncbi:hypothetical protein KBY71_12590 [Cyanobium sp. T1B-Tous]|uniref:hypothetical protein n=1 Tax=Cyanobium sp. T1B-Tous TaxID=2823721 RepID=UPI0020CFC5E2|nr:hypothetical protein [Cyanobium sp. T1B-Tous]MCP9807350.1 hypothetical protein [Cyanobium sp. T1B-Tous]